MCICSVNLSRIYIYGIRCIMFNKVCTNNDVVCLINPDPSCLTNRGVLYLARQCMALAMINKFCRFIKMTSNTT